MVICSILAGAWVAISTVAFLWLGDQTLRTYEDCPEKVFGYIAYRERLFIRLATPAALLTGLLFGLGAFFALDFASVWRPVAVFAVGSLVHWAMLLSAVKAGQGTARRRAEFYLVPESAEAYARLDRQQNPYGDRLYLHPNEMVDYHDGRYYPDRISE